MAIQSFSSVSPPSTPPASSGQGQPSRVGEERQSTGAPLAPSPVSQSPQSPQAMRERQQGRPPFATKSLGALPALALGAITLLIWQFVTQAGLVAAFLLPAPADVARSFWLSLSDGLLTSYALQTLIESLAGFALGSVVALPLGYAMAHSQLLARTFQPYLAASQALPAVAIAPLLMVWVGFDLPPVIMLCALISFFPSVITTVLGLRTLDRDVLDAGRVEGAGRWALLWHIELPLALPSILAGLRASLTLSVTGAVVGEFVLGNQGLGGLLLIARGNLDTPLVFATLLMLMLLASAFYGIARLVERQFSYVEAS
ncbi:MAG TPA: ABC transporter permease [Ktedonobacterales bacterium]